MRKDKVKNPFGNRRGCGQVLLACNAKVAYAVNFRTGAQHQKTDTAYKDEIGFRIKL